MSTDRWFHGTRADFERGGVLLPRQYTGAAPTTAPVNPGMVVPQTASRVVHITRDLDVAWQYAQAAAGDGTPKILEVTPVGVVNRDPEHSWRTDAWTCDWAQVIAVFTSPDDARDDWRPWWLRG